jgi:hypothetical protein
MKSATNSILKIAPMVELADTPVLGTGLLRGTSSSLVRRTKTVAKSVYVNVYEDNLLSTKQEGSCVVLLEKVYVASLRKNHTYPFIYTSVNYYLITCGFFNINSNSLVWWSCRQIIGLYRRHSQVFFKETKKCHRKLHRRQHYSYNLKN